MKLASKNPILRHKMIVKATKKQINELLVNILLTDHLSSYDLN